VALRTELEGKHGKKRKAWPADAEARYKAAEDANERASDVAWYGGNPQADLDDSLRDLTEAISGKSWLSLAPSRDAADLVLELLGRGRGRLGGQLGNSSHFAIRLSAGAKMDPAIVHNLKMKFTVGLIRRVPVFERESPPVIALEILGTGVIWRFAAKATADELDYIVKTNKDVIAAARR
jgi:hypothetical protein